ncbi:MAG: glycosyltransferase family 4 protein [Patescibacteria group bacterium]|jgi:glycosyltransferase involved in cell wall biosynthesis
MKILMVSPRFTPKSGGGGFVITKNLIKELDKRGHNIGVFTSDYQFDVNEAYSGLNQNSKHVWLMPFKTLITLMGFHITKPHINWRKGVFTEDIDVVHMQGCRTWQNIVAYEQCNKYNIPYIVDAHGFPIQGSWLHKLILRTFDFLFANKIVRGASMCIAETEVGKKEYLRAGVKEENIKIIPCPYDLSIFDNFPPKGEFKKKNGIPSNRRIVGFLGGFDRIKGLDFLVESFAKINEQKDVLLVLAGTDMGFKKELEDLVCKLGIENRVFYTGYISGRDKLEYLVDCDVCVFPSRAEQGLPFAALEALMCNVTIIVTDGTGSAEDVAKMKCGLVSDWDMADIVDDIEQVLDNQTLNKILVQNGQDYIRKNLSITEKVKDYEEVYRSIAK